MNKGNQQKQYANTYQTAINLPKDSVAPSHQHHLTQVNNLNAHTKLMVEEEIAAPDLANQRDVQDVDSGDEESENDVVPALQN